MSSWNFITQSDSKSIDFDKEDSNSSIGSLSSTMSLDFIEDVTSSSSSSSNGPLYQLSGLMDQLPIKRGLSKYYQGKSQSFATLKSVESLEELAKKVNPYMKKMKLTKKLTNLKATISKNKATQGFLNISLN